MAVFVLVHGMWHGGWCWKKLAPLLRAAGHEVYTPTLTGLGERSHLRCSEVSLETHIQDVTNLILFEELNDVVLVGHSYGGYLVPLVTELIPERIACLVNLDGVFPENGKGGKDLIGDTWDFFQKHAAGAGDPAWIPPVPEWTFGVSGADLAWMQGKLTAHPAKTLIDPAVMANPAAAAIPCTFISCIEQPTAEGTAAEEKHYADLGYTYRYLPTGHDAMLTMPEELAEILIGLISLAPKGFQYP